MSFNITVEGGSAVRLPTAGKYCDRDIVVTATGGAENLNAVLTEQESLIVTLKDTLKGKTSGGGSETTDALITRTITKISSEVASIGYYAFCNCDLLEFVNLPNVKNVAGYGFMNCSSLKSVSLPNVTGINGYAFSGCVSLANVDIPKITSLGQYVFRNCSALQRIDIQLTGNIGVFTFYECTNLETLILRKADKPCTLASNNVLQKTKIADGTGYIYVADNLVDAYRSATNWATYASQIKPLSKLEV